MKLRWGGVVLGAVAAGLLAWWWQQPAETSVSSERHGPMSVTEPREASAPTPVVSATGAGAPFSAAGLQSRQEQLALWRARQERAEQVYTSYRDSTRYPFDSRPISEHPDQVRPFAPIEEELRLRGANGEVLKGLRLRTSQERVFLSGSDSVKFTVEAVDDSGRSLPLTIRNASAQSIPDSRTPVQTIQSATPFADDGAGAAEGGAAIGDDRAGARVGAVDEQRAVVHQRGARVSVGGTQYRHTANPRADRAAETAVAGNHAAVSLRGTVGVERREPGLAGVERRLVVVVGDNDRTVEGETSGEAWFKKIGDGTAGAVHERKGSRAGSDGTAGEFGNHIARQPGLLVGPAPATLPVNQIPLAKGPGLDELLARLGRKTDALGVNKSFAALPFRELPYWYFARSFRVVASNAAASVFQTCSASFFNSPCFTDSVPRLMKLAQSRQFATTSAGTPSVGIASIAATAFNPASADFSPAPG